MKMLKKIFIISAIFYINSKTVRNPFQFKLQEKSESQIIPSDTKFKVIGYGKSGAGIRFVVIDKGSKTETLTEKDPGWALYSN